VCVYVCVCVRARVSGSSAGIGTDYRLDDPGWNPGRDEIFRPSRPALGPTQPPVKWVPGNGPKVARIPKQFILQSILTAAIPILQNE